MALKNCKECSHQISSDAATCPSCGAKQPKKTSSGVKLLALFFVAVFAVAIFGPKHETAPPTAEERAESELLSKQILLGRIATVAIKQAARDPDSVVFESVGVNKEIDVACVAYRAKNGFGGMNREHLALVHGKALSESAAWNKNCTKPMTDVKDLL